jgi:aryl-alcohol dehydrogenase-like predicted oxidoreductase
MEYTRLGRTGLKVSRLALGTMNLGNQTSEEISFAILDRALALGINLVDTANVYGGKNQQGNTEALLGRWLAQGGKRRDSIVLATKVFGGMGDGPNDRRLSAYHIRQACEASLRRLQTDHIDLYQMHHVDRETPWEEIAQAFEQLMREGKILYAGASNFAAWHIASADALFRHRGTLGLISEQSLYNLIQRTVELEVIPCCRELGLGLLPWSPLAGGLLGGLKLRSEGVRRLASQANRDFEKHRSQLDSFEAFCDDMGEEPAQVAIAWLLHNPVVTAPILGPRTLEQLEASQRALEIRLGAEDMEWLNTLWPGPGGEAPEAYAW